MISFEPFGMSTAQIIAAWLIIAGAYFVRGITGAGSALIATPLLVQFMPIQTVVPTMLLLDFTASCLMSRATISHGDWSEVKRLLPTGIAGICLGAWLLLKLPQQFLLLALGLLIVLFGLRNIGGGAITEAISPRWSHLAGLLGGAIGATFGTGGPPYIIYLSRRIDDKSALRATLSRLFLVEGAVRIVVFTLTGLLLQTAPLLLWAGGLTALWLGLRLGGRVHLVISHAQMQRMIGALLVISGCALAVKAL